LTFGLALILMLIASINYNLSLGYVLTFSARGPGHRFDPAHLQEISRIFM